MDMEISISFVVGNAMIAESTVSLFAVSIVSFSDLFTFTQCLDSYFIDKMGQIMGTMLTRHVNLNSNDLPSFDPNVGFDYERTERVTTAGDDKLASAKIPLKFRDYCGDELLKYQVCRYKHFPFLYKCHHERHAYLNCEHDDYIIRMKEFEREKRLREREVRITGTTGNCAPFVSSSCG